MSPADDPVAPSAQPSAAPVFRRFCTLVALLAAAYAMALPLVYSVAGPASSMADFLALWSAVPLQVMALVLIGALLFNRPLAERAPPRLWWTVFAYSALSLIANYVWNIVRSTVSTEELTGADALYLLDYWILTAAFAVLFVRAGGTFKSVRVGLDAVTMTVVQLVAIWSFFLSPEMPHRIGQDVTVAAVLAYSTTLAAMMTMGALLCIQLPDFRGRSSILLLIAAGLAAVAWEIIWLASWLVNYQFVGRYCNYGDVLGFTCIIGAVAALQYHAPLRAEPCNIERRVDGFFPALAVLMTIALVGGSYATTKGLENWILVGLVALCALLMITRQRSVRTELRALNRQLAAREADARLTELVRSSTDLIVVVDGEGIVSFASPAASSMLLMPPAAINGMKAANLFGSAHEFSMRGFLNRAFGQVESTEVLEIHMERRNDNTRIYEVCAANQLANALIKGIVLTIHDVSGQRALEREVLDVATRERVRLCADIHDGLGQELTGIALLLHGAAAAPDPDPEKQRRELDSIVGHVNRTIGTARDLARGLSPLHVDRGSLSGALRRLARDTSTRVPTSLTIDPEFDDRILDDLSADHLYRIVQEAVINSSRHSGCARIDIDMRTAGGSLIVRVVDDGSGISECASDNAGIGLRLMEYRARILGGVLRTVSSLGLGTCIEVTMHLHGAMTVSEN